MSADSAGKPDDANADFSVEKRSGPANRLPFGHILRTRLSRRAVLAAGMGVATGTVLVSCGSGESAKTGPYGFVEPAWAVDAHLHVPPGYRVDLLLRWGDPLSANASGLELHRMEAWAQAGQFGYNCGYTGFLPLERGSSRRGLLAVNHEHSLPHLMYPGSPASGELSAEQLQADMAAQGMSIVEVVQDSSGWHYRPASFYNRRITPHTPMLLDGPAAGHRRLQLNGRDGFSTRGTWNNCAGATTPWGTVLTTESNLQLYFQGNPDAGPEAENHERYGIAGRPGFDWYRAETRWQLDADPAYPLYGGWVVELDPHNPRSVPVKHTALGRMRHESCAIRLNKDGRLVCYMGDAQAFEYLYRYVSRGRYSTGQHGQLLQDGVLSVAVFLPDGRLEWRPLIYGREPLTAASGFANQGDVLLDTRRAADLLGATPMDRPGGIAISPMTGRVYCGLMGNSGRVQADAANPRAENPFGHILEFIPPAEDHAADIFGWEVFLLAGRNGQESGSHHPQAGENSHFIKPKSLAFDPFGSLWMATDGAGGFDLADALMVTHVQGDRRRWPSRFLTAPLGAGVAGPGFTPDGRTLFCSIQHPGAVQGSHFEQPATRWPDFHANVPPRPSVIAVTRKDGGPLVD